MPPRTWWAPGWARLEGDANLRALRAVGSASGRRRGKQSGFGVAEQGPFGLALAAGGAEGEEKRSEVLHDIWGPRYRPRHIKQGNQFTIALRRHALVHWGCNGWNDVRDSDTRDTGLAVWVTELPVAGLKPGATIQFTFYWHEDAAWEGQEYEVLVTA